MNKPLILIIEDEVDMRNFISRVIEETGRYTTITASNGKEGFEVLDKNKRFLGIAENRIKCIILDLKMPEMNGTQFLKRLRKEEPHNKLMPVIVLSAYEDEDKWNQVTSSHAGLSAAYLTKPFKQQELIDTIDRVFHHEIGQMIDETRQKKYERLEELKQNPSP